MPLSHRWPQRLSGCIDYDGNNRTASRPYLSPDSFLNALFSKCSSQSALLNAFIKSTAHHEVAKAKSAKADIRGMSGLPGAKTAGRVEPATQ
ncbi:hypothetical protein [Dickeya lacustris]|uniref:Uncharacterized protein n=1 Tax=Dickeya lacustris TaxID=2259638 RepID=A0ABY8G970_9GAMM|nr:hypothetical protein [Dickeya lacustris]WFN56508.1 hypothetical protein O1Q98_04235 [Dickeya lacustris]